MGQFAVNDMQVRATDATGADLDANLAGPWLSIRELGPLKRRANRVQHHGLHGVRPPLRQRSVGEEGASILAQQQIAGDAAERPFPQAVVSVGAGHDQVGALVIENLIETVGIVSGT